MRHYGSSFLTFLNKWTLEESVESMEPHPRGKTHCHIWFEGQKLWRPEASISTSLWEQSCETSQDSYLSCETQQSPIASCWGCQMTYLTSVWYPTAAKGLEKLWNHSWGKRTKKTTIISPETHRSISTFSALSETKCLSHILRSQTVNGEKVSMKDKELNSMTSSH